MKILIVDDSLTVRKLIKSHIDTIGSYEILEAENGLNALEIMNQIKNIFLVVTDINMPKMSGLEFARELKKDKTHQFVNFIFITTETTKEYLTEALRLGAINFLRKPLNPETFLNTVKKVISDFENNRVVMEEEEKRLFLEKIIEEAPFISLSEGVITVSKNDRIMEIPLSRVKFYKTCQDYSI